jgi:hypothetical protein
MPDANVTVSAEFEATVPSGQTVDEGIKALAEGRFDAAIDAFESAYQQNQNDRAAIVYSSLGRLASIARDPTVKNMMQNRLGFTGYPGTIDSLITGDWMESYVDEELVYWYYENDNSYTWFDPNDEWDVPFFNRYGLSLKAGYYYQEYLGETRHTLVHQEKIDGIHSYYDYDFGGWVEWYDDDPGEGDRGAGYYWSTSYTYLLASETARYHTRNERAPGLDLPVWFTETGAYTSNVTSAGTLQASAWPLLLFANLVDKNQDGLNSLLDALLSSVFGSSFEDAAGRFSNLAYNQFIEVDRDIIDAFGLSELLEGDDLYIGKAELDLLFSAVRLFKASLEWVAAYDWNTDISFLKTDWQTIVDRIDTLAPGNLPFGNNFMKDRGKGMMTNSKNDFLKALGDAVGTYDHLAGVDSELPGAYVDALKEYGWVKDGLSKLKNAIQSGGTFYVPERAPSGNSYPNTPVNSALGFDMGKLFTPGQFAIDQLIETESGGRSPQFYAFGADDSPVPISSKAQMDSLNESYYIGFKLKMNRVKEAVLGLDHYEHETTSIPLFPVQIGKDLYGLYHK